MKSLSRVRLLVTPWTTAYQAPPSMGFSRQQYWNGVPLPSPPSYVVGTNYRVLTYCTCHFQGGSFGFSFFCLLVSSVSDFRPNTRWAMVDTLFRLTCSVALWVGRDLRTNEQPCKEITLACARSVSATLGLPLLTVHVLSLPTLLRF